MSQLNDGRMPGRAFLLIGGEASLKASDPFDWTTFAAGKVLMLELERGQFTERLR